MTKGLLAEKLTLLTLHCRVTDHTGGTAYKSYRLVAGTLEMLKHHDTDKVSYV